MRASLFFDFFAISTSTSSLLQLVHFTLLLECASRTLQRVNVELPRHGRKSQSPARLISSSSAAAFGDLWYRCLCSSSPEASRPAADGSRRCALCGLGHPLQSALPCITDPVPPPSDLSPPGLLPPPTASHPSPRSAAPHGSPTRTVTRRKATLSPPCACRLPGPPSCDPRAPTAMARPERLNPTAPRTPASRRCAC